MTKNEFNARKSFSLSEVAALFQRTTVNIWYLVRDGKVKARFEQGETNRKGIELSKAQVMKVPTLLRGNPPMHFERKGRSQAEA